MKLKCVLLFVLVLADGLSAGAQTTEKPPALNGRFPASFPSIESAMAHKRQMGAGGRVDVVRFALSSYLVVFRHGSGRPVIEIGIYRWSLWLQQWELVSVASPPTMREFFRAKASHGKIVVVGDRSVQEWPIFEPE
jgi:hypothetical protein